MKLAWQTWFREATAEAKEQQEVAMPTDSQYGTKTTDSVDKSSRMKDAIFGHKLAYRVKKKK